MQQSELNAKPASPNVRPVAPRTYKRSQTPAVSAAPLFGVSPVIRSAKRWSARTAAINGNKNA